MRPKKNPSLRHMIEGYEDGSGAVGGKKGMPHVVISPAARFDTLKHERQTLQLDQKWYRGQKKGGSA